MGKHLPVPRGPHCRPHRSLYDGDGSPARGKGYSEMLGRASRFAPHLPPSTRVHTSNSTFG